MTKTKWKPFKTAFPFICSICKKLLWEVRDTCEGCGERLTIRETTKEDYKEWKRH